MPKNLTKIILTVTAVCLLTGCGTIGGLNNNPEYEWLTGGDRVDKGDRPGDPCIRCGENFIFIPNEDMGALREVERQGFVWGSKDPEVQKKLWY